MISRIRLSASLLCTRAGACCALVLLLSPGARGAVAPLGPSYPVSGIEIEYALDHPRQIDEQELLDLEVGLTPVGDAYTAPRPVDRTVRMRLSSLPRGAVLTASAIQHINQYIVSTFNRRGFNGVIVTVPDIDERTGRDLRSGGRTGLRLRIWTGRVSRVTTIADGERFASLTVDERTNMTAHEWIRERAPVQPGGLRGLLDVKSLDDYAAKLSRHRGRRVDAELVPGKHPGTTQVNLRIAEQKPWNVYAQYANTGTSATTKNRERFGLVHGQLTGRDDVLRVDYATGDFEDVHVVSGSYEGPFSLRAPDLRFRLGGLYGEFDAAEVGFVDGRFLGQQEIAEGSLRYNALQHHELFVDVSAGARWQRMKVDNRQLPRKDTVTFLIPSVGVSGERRTRISDLLFGVDVDYGLTDASSSELDTMGNPNADDRFVVARWDGSYSFYLEPLVNRAGWENPETPASSTLAHEVALSLSGQWAFDDRRLVPQHQRIAGGLFTVRGYKQAAAAGDSVVLGSAEYRFHLPRMLAPAEEAPKLPGIGSFRIRPQQVYARPDWDLVFKVFSDAARVLQNDRISSESNETLFSVGGGVEMQLLRNLSLRFDAGHVLSTVGSSESGDTRGHVLATVLY